jgi:hypothetical protein
MFCAIRCSMFLNMDVSSQSADTIKLIFIPSVLTGIRAKRHQTYLTDREAVSAWGGGRACGETFPERKVHGADLVHPLLGRVVRRVRGAGRVLEPAFEAVLSA